MTLLPLSIGEHSRITAETEHQVVGRTEAVPEFLGVAAGGVQEQFEFPVAVPGGAGGGVGDCADPQPAAGHRINLVGDRGQAQDPLDVPDNVGPVHRAEPHELSGDIALGVTHGQVRRARGSVWKSGEKPQEGPQIVPCRHRR